MQVSSHTLVVEGGSLSFSVKSNAKSQAQPGVVRVDFTELIGAAILSYSEQGRITCAITGHRA